MDDDRRLIDRRVSELRRTKKKQGWEFRIVEESATEVVCEVWDVFRPEVGRHRFSVTADDKREVPFLIAADGEPELGGDKSGEGDGEKRSGGRLLMGDDDRRPIGQRVAELRDATLEEGWEFRIVEESAIEVVYETRPPRGALHRVSVTAERVREVQFEKRVPGGRAATLLILAGFFVGGVAGRAVVAARSQDSEAFLGGLPAAADQLVGIFNGAIIGALVVGMTLAVIYWRSRLRRAWEWWRHGGRR